jgi:hypothetical protein
MSETSMTGIIDTLHYDPQLPPELATALIEFDAWSKSKLLLEQNESTPSQPIYHYTGDVSLSGILSRQRIWCFSLLHQSDPTEFEYSLAIARRVILEIGNSNDFFTKHFCACLDDLLETNWLAGPFDFYLFSLSRHRDDAQQWREYGKDGYGYAIGFAPSLFQPDRNDLDKDPTKNLHVGRVIYGDTATADRHRLIVTRAAEITSRVGTSNIEAVRVAKLSYYLVSVAREVLASQLVWNCLTAKDQHFANEKEIRCIIMNVRANFDPYRRALGTRNYVEHELPLKAKGAIAEILIGPHAPADAEAKVAALLHDEGYPDDIPILRSSLSHCLMT